MLFSVLGPLEVRDAGKSLAIGGPRQRSVLALLLLDLGRAVSADRLVTEIWGDEPPAGARDSLYTYVSNLRGVLGRDRLVRADGGYRLDTIEGDTIDAAEIDARLAEARRLAGSDPAGAIALIDESLDSWRGQPYEGLEDLPSVVPEAARLEELRLRALEDRIEAELRSGSVPEVGGVELLTVAHPYRERFWELLARVLYRAGRQTDALRALSRLRGMLADDLGIDPSPSVARLEERILLQDPALEEGTTTPTNLPAPITDFIGRAEELDRLEALILEHRLVTVTGPGGAGKTRLAIEAAARVGDAFPDGVWFVDLAQVATPEMAAEAITSAMRLAASATPNTTDALVARLRPETTLIVLDNCEHLADAAGRLSVRLLAAAPGLRILATSRRSLETIGEHCVRLEGLVTSGDGSGDAERLFETRAAAVRPGFSLDDAGSVAVTSICRHLDGLPLAIELAAARADALSPDEIDGYLRDRFRLLGDPRRDRPVHRSLQGCLDWSYRLLRPDDRDAFDRLGVFEGPFLSTAASAVLGTESEIAAVDALRRLAGASLLQVLPGEASRYRLLETMRLYGRAHLNEAGSWDDAVECHDGHYRNQCCEQRGAVFGSGRTGARIVMEAELAEYEAGFDRLTAAGRVEEALDMGWPLGHAWLFSGRLDRGIGRLEGLIDASAGVEIRSRADTLTAASFLIMYLSRYDQAIRWADEAAAIYRKVGDEQGLAYALARRGHLAFSVGDVPTALALLQESLEICGRIGYEEGAAWPLTLLGQARLWTGDESDEVRGMLEEGRRRFIAIGDTYGQMHANMFIPNVGDQSVEAKLRYARESVELIDRPGADPLIRPTALHNLAFTSWEAGDRERAVGLNRISAQAALEMGTTVTSAMAFLQAGLFAGAGGDGDRAAVLYGAGDRHFVMQRPPFYIRQLQPGIDAATDALGEERYEQYYERGQAMSIEEATTFLLGGVVHRR
jgi:predicted ATPase/DNA-binding SARP family transcriptional activator